MRDWLVKVSVGLALSTTAAACTAVSDSQDSIVLAAQVDALFLREVRPDTTGCAVGVYRGGEIVLARGYGVASIEDGRPITSRTTFNLGSASKPFTALAALMLEGRSQLSMDDDVRRWVPELPNYGRPIRVRDLLQHTSGVRDFQTLQLLSRRAVTTQPQFLELIASQRALNFEPGTRHEYSHSDFGVLGLVVERIVGRPFGEHLQDAVFDPLEMKGSFVDDLGNGPVRDRAFGHLVSPQGPSVQFPDSQTFGGDNVYSSVEDLAHWDRNFDNPKVGGAAAIARMLSRPTLPDGETIPYAYGLRLGTYRQPLVERGDANR
jgi:CubicO group peptidase (beta-lactamase class C family)